MTEAIKWPLSVPPREVQLEALAKGYGKPGFAYFMRQRLGKTWVAFSEFTLLREEGKVDWMIVICPNSLKRQWQDAIEQVDPYIPIRVYNSSQKQKTDLWFKKNKSGGVFIINYESVKSFMDNEGWSKFNPLRAYIVGDESTKIAEFNTKMSKACLELASLCTYTRVLTGKPRKNSNSDLWAQLKFIRATDRSYYAHKHTFTIVGGFKGRQSVADVNVEKLKTEMEPHCYIAPDKYLVGFERVYEPMREINLTGKQLELYKKMQNELIFELAQDVTITAPIAVVKYLRLQQISSGIAGDIDGQQHNIVEPEHNPRIRETINILDNEVDNKAIIVCRFRLSMKNLHDMLVKKGYKVSLLQGHMKLSDVEEQKALFNSGENNILIGQTQVLNFGHTLCGPDDNPCDSVIFYENDFSVVNRDQCEARPEKMGRNKPISYYDMYASKMDRYILESLRKKEDASTALMGYARKRGILTNMVKEEEEAEDYLNL